MDVRCSILLDPSRKCASPRVRRTVTINDKKTEGVDDSDVPTSSDNQASDNSSDEKEVNIATNSTPNTPRPTTSGNLDSLQKFLAPTKRVRLYRNGDRFFKGLWYTVQVRSWDTFLEDLNRLLRDSISLPHGVRYVYNFEGNKVTTLDELSNGCSYICSSSEKLKDVDYASDKPSWTFANLTKDEKPGGLSLRATSFAREPNDFVHPRIITVIRNGLKPRRVARHLLNKRTAQSFEQVMQDITAIANLQSGIVRKLFTLSGKPVTRLVDFFGDDDVFIAYGTEQISKDDFYVISEEFKAICFRQRDRKKNIVVKPHMPRRNDGFNKSRSPACPSASSQLPPELQASVRILELLGDGNTALVYKAEFRETGKLHALKIVSKENADEIKDLVRTEVELMRSIAHEHIVELRNFWLHDDAWFIQLELIPDGDLFEHMRKVRVLDERNAASAIKCLASALEYLHANAIVHRDVKPENLLIYTDQANLLRLKLADFGLATRINEGELLYHICGTPTYVAPEVLAEYGYSSPADCWSMGVILFVMLCGFPPFMSMRGDEMELFDKILRCELEFPAPAWEAISWSAKWLVRSLLFPDADSRLTPTNMLTRAWIKIPGHVDAEEEKESELQMNSEEDEEAGDGDASAEYYHSRRASMDELSDCRDEKSFSPIDYDSSDDDEGHGRGREKSFVFVSTNK